MASEEICSDSTPDFPPKCRHFGTLNAIILHLFGLKRVETLTIRGFILIQQGSPGVVVISLYYELLKEFYGKLFRLQTQ